jgi:hypothetical protein
MTNIHRGICWATAILLTVTAKKYGVFDAEAADTLLLVLPIIAILSFKNGLDCRLPRKKGA